MNDKGMEGARNRTNAKIRYAAVHLDELREIERRGDAFERAHQESFLFHLLGARDAFLQELNLYYGCGLKLKDVRRERLERELRKLDRQSPALQKLITLEADPSSWISLAKEMRDHSTHRDSLPRVYHVGGPRHDQVFLTDTRSGQHVEEDYIQLFESWQALMALLIRDFRETT